MVVGTIDENKLQNVLAFIFAHVFLFFWNKGKGFVRDFCSDMYVCMSLYECVSVLTSLALSLSLSDRMFIVRQTRFQRSGKAVAS